MGTSSFLLILVLILLSGVIAYVGDFLGRRVGKRKLSVLALRPRHTAILVSIITGILISAVTLAILSVASQDVRTALFGMEELKAKLASLNEEVLARNAEIERMKEMVRMYEEQVALLSQKEKELSLSRASLEEQVRSLQGSISELEKQRKALQDEIQSLQMELTRLRANLLAVRQGEIVFRDEEEILRTVVQGGISQDEAERFLLSLIRRATIIAQARGAGQDREGRGVVFVQEGNFKETVAELSSGKGEYVVRLVAALNTVRGEPVIARFVLGENKKIFSQGEVILRRALTLKKGETNSDLVLAEVLRDLNVLGVEKGVLPQDGKVGVISALNLSEVTQELEKREGEVFLEAVAESDVYTAGPMRVLLRVQDKAPEG
ncbi:DUF3084 domain-containing protein [Candidatus Caldatribacterium sp.]|uniref:DUF3084 domain-containing protein n=1 Tax=Candidatus Caldatribacterium sp. TaxID=2282143 RepID=UPI0029943A0B|nr:DUF3084 domain-containing protein [Candidatus Caldatribacterium sp.]MDW8081960.1 DUF3084 domain-containing protein [Candidatus Calescibacterium sp.]